MCGIAGIAGQPPQTSIPQVEAMLASMVHRGPDQHGVSIQSQSPGVVIGHRRLSIIDLSEAGKQPMVHEPTKVVITYNGECYNYRAIRQELASIGHRFQSSSDTEVVLAAYAEWGVNSLKKLRGMFAFAIWDPRDGSLLLVRDRLGIKPLYYLKEDECFVFSSEVRAMLESGHVDRRLNPKALEAYLWNGFVPGPETIVRKVRLLEPGHYLRVDGYGMILEEGEYWGLSDRYLDRKPPSLQEISATLEEAVSMRLVSDVPLGVFLSGGIDSSVVAAVAQRNSNTPVSTFNIRFEEATYDESPYARRVASALGTEHSEVTLSERIFADNLEPALNSIDQPTFDAINSYFVSRAVREQGITVALAGTGGDELFGGYPSFSQIPRMRRAASVLGRMPQRLRRGLSFGATRLLMGRGAEVPPQTRWGKLDDLLATRGDLVALYQVSYGLFSRDMLRELSLSDSAGLEWGLSAQRLKELKTLIRGDGALTAISKLELKSFVGERLLRDTDAASMAVSLEVRLPLLDHRLVESLFGLSENVRFHPLGRKVALKRFVANQLPSEMFERPKAGFELPLAIWCRSLLSARLDDTFTDINLIHAVGLNAETVGRLWRSFKGGGTGLYWSRVWSLFILLNWCRRHGVYL